MADLPPPTGQPPWIEFLGTVVVTLLAVISITILYNRLVRQRDTVRDRDMSDLARKLGLRYAPNDTFDLLRLPFELIRTGGRAMILNVVWGELQGTPLTAFEYRRFSRETVNNRERPWAFSCVMGTLPVNASEVVIEREAPDAYQLGRSIRRAPRVQTESAEFDRTFSVHAKDERFALSLLDPAVMGWLLTTPGTWNFEFNGGRLLCYSPLRAVAQVEALMMTMRDLHDRIPSVVQDFAPVAAIGSEALQRGRLPGESQPRKSIRVSSIVVAFGVLAFLAALVGVAYYVASSAAKGAL